MLATYRGMLRAWFDLPLRFKGMIIISIPLLCILFSAASLYVFQKQRDYLSEWISRAFLAGSRIQAVVTLLSDAESGTRGFLLTRDKKYLEPLYKAERDLPKRLRILKEGLRSSSAQMQRLDRITSLSRERPSKLSSTASDLESPARGYGLREGGVLSASIETEFAAMRAEESGLWAQRIAAETSLRQRLSAAMYGGAILSLLAGGLAMALFLTGIVRRLHLLQENANRLVREEALLELAPLGDEIGRLGEALAWSSRILAGKEAELRRLNLDLDRRVKEGTSQLEQETAERKRSEEQLRQAQKMEAIGQLAGGIAHDFNNLLTVIVGYAGRLLKRLPEQDQAHKEVRQIHKAGQSAAELTQRLLAFSRKQMLQPQVVDLNTVITEMAPLLQRLIGEHIELVMSLAPEIGQVRADPVQFEQIIINLSINARDAMPSGGKLIIETADIELNDVYARTHIVKPGRYVRVSVSDTGSGMDAHTKEHALEPFFTTKGVGKGTGLGLSMVYGAVKQSGGDMSLYSEPGMGTTVTIFFPRLEQQPAAHKISSPALVELRGSETILLVEDDESVLEYTAETVRELGYELLVAGRPEEACTISRGYRGPIHLLLTDVIMPGLNGPQLADQLCRDRSDLRVLYMSGYAEASIIHLGALESGLDFLPKPFSSDAMAQKIREILDRPAPVLAEKGLVQDSCSQAYAET